MPTSIDNLATYLSDGLEHPVPLHANPSDHALDVVNTDFLRDAKQASEHIQRIAGAWTAYAARYPDAHELNPIVKAKDAPSLKQKGGYAQGLKIGLHRTWYLIIRNWINYSRNLLAYGVRLGMYRKWIP